MQQRWRIVEAVVFLMVTAALLSVSFANPDTLEFSSLLRVSSVSTKFASSKDDAAALSLHGNHLGRFNFRHHPHSHTTQQVLVRLSDGDGDEVTMKEWIRSRMGHTLGEYIGDGVYIMQANVERLQQQWAQDKRLRSVVVGQYRPEHKFVEEQFRIDGADIIAERRRAVMMENKFNSVATGIAFEKRKTAGEGGLKRSSTVTAPRMDSLKGRHSSPDSDDTEWRMVIQETDGERLLVLNVLLEKSIPVVQEVVPTKQYEQRTAQQLQSLVHQIEGAMLKNRFQLGSRSKQVVIASPNKLVILARQHDALDVARMLSTHHDIAWIEVKPRWESHNKWAKWITQSNVKDEMPISGDRKLTGSGEIVGVGDSGLDWNSCFFQDVNNPIPFTDKPSKVDSSHRKIKGYWGLLDNISEDDAHGTHVAGTILGKTASESPISPYNGIAEDAKVLFTDIGCSEPGGCTCHGVPCDCDLEMMGKCEASDRAVYLPLDLNEHYFPFAYDNGARIHSNSWGGGSGILGYSISSKEIDEFAYHHKDFLILFSAGNSGEILGYASLGTHAESKNALSVGASMNTIEMFKAAARNRDYDQLAKMYGALIAEEMGCGNDKSCEKRAPQFERECEYFAKNFTTEADCCSTTGLYCKPTWLSLCGCSKYDVGMLCCGKCVNAMFETQRASVYYDHENLAYFSSRGPAVDLRIKPDIVAPGHSLLSAKSHNTANNPQVCGRVPESELTKHLVSMGGTSMSTPLTAGAAALVRQYFREGYWNKGVKDSSAAFSPSSALLRAMLINSGQQLRGYLDIGENTLIKIHDDKNVVLSTKLLEGHGRVQLDKVLSFNDGSNFKLLIPRRSSEQLHSDPLLSTGAYHDYCIVVEDTGEFKATLAWTDYPSTPAAEKHLVNDLDLALIDSNNDLWLGNSNVKNSIVHDRINNVEQIRIVNAKPGSYVVHVEGVTVPEGPQDYALVVTGNVSLVECSSPNEFYTRMGQIGNETDETAMLYSIIMVLAVTTALALGVLLLLITINALIGVYAYMRWKRKSLVSDRGVRLQDEEVYEMDNHIERFRSEAMDTPVIEQSVQVEPGVAVDEDK